MSKEISEMSYEEKSKKPSLVGMITHPVEQFERIRKRPHIWKALIMIMILFGIGASLGSLGMDIDYGELRLTEDEKEMVNVFTRGTVIVIGFISPLVIILILSVIYLIIAKIAQANVTFKQLFSMNTYILIISALGVIVNHAIALIIGSDPDVFVTSLGSAIDAPGVVGVLLQSIELFSIWGLIVTVIGLQKVAHFSKGLAWGVQITRFIIVVIFAMIGAGIGQMVGG